MIVGHAAVADRDNQRVFYHTRVDDEFGGRGLATILVREALEAARADGKRVVPVCEMVAGVLKKDSEFDDIVDPVTPDVQQWAQTLPTG
jgi:predicted GNAT family acetyltransferase